MKESNGPTPRRFCPPCCPVSIKGGGAGLWSFQFRMHLCFPGCYPFGCADLPGPPQGREHEPMTMQSVFPRAQALWLDMDGTAPLGKTRVELIRECAGSSRNLFGSFACGTIGAVEKPDTGYFSTHRLVFQPLISNEVIQIADSLVFSQLIRGAHVMSGKASDRVNITPNR